MKHEFTDPNIPQWNGVAVKQRDYRDDSMSAGRSKSTEDVLGAINVDSLRIRNVCASSSKEKRLSPTEILYEKSSKMSYFCVFRCLAYYLDGGKRQQLDPKGKKNKFMGYDEESKAYLLVNLETTRARSVTLKENIFPDGFMVDSEVLNS